MKKLAQGAIGTGSGTLAYTVPQGYKTEVTNIDICNTTTSSLTLLLYLVPTGGTPTASNTFIPTVSIPANTMFQWIGSQLINEGDFIQCIGSGAGLTMNITGNEVRA